MTLRRAVSCLAMVAATACSLNPQPLPPDNPGDASLPNGANGSSPDAASPSDRLEGGTASADAAIADATPMPVPPPSDGGATDAQADAMPDGEEDAADGATDATGDATGD